MTLIIQIPVLSCIVGFNNYVTSKNKHANNNNNNNVLLVGVITNPETMSTIGLLFHVGPMPMPESNLNPTQPDVS